VPSLLGDAVSDAPPTHDGDDDPAAWHDSDLLALVDLKWLLAAHGQWLNLARLRQDDGYARVALEQARDLPSELIRRVVKRVINRLDAAPH
jgi:hypothetical protein